MRYLLIFIFFSLLSMERDVEEGFPRDELTVVVPRHQRHRSSIMLVEDVSEEHICQLAFQSFSFHDSPHISRIRDFLCRHIRTQLQTPSSSERDNLRALDSFNGSSLEDEYLKRYLQELLLRATTDALAKAESEAQEHKEEADARVSKTKATYYAIASSTVTALLGIGATILTHYTD